MNDAPIITRGGFLRGILAAGVAPAIIPVAEAHSVAGLRRGLALRQAMAGGGWQNPYITDGLVGMWDGEWNAGGGVHDASATVWKDLVGSNDLELTSGGSFGDDFLLNIADNVGAVGNGLMDAEGTLEVVIGCDNWYNYDSNYLVYFGKRLQFGRRNYLINGNGVDGSGQFGAAVNFSYNILGKKSFSITRLPEQRDGKILINSVPCEMTHYSVNAYTPPENMSVYAKRYSNRYYCIRAYGRELTQPEIAANYAIDAERFGLT